MRTTLCKVGLVVALVAVGPRLVAEAEPPAAPSAEQWVERLHQATTEVEKKSALEALKSTAAGLPTSAETREALFALANHHLAGADATPREAVQALDSATALFPTDARTPELLRRLSALQVAASDSYGAHSSFRRLVEGGHLTGQPDWMARAAANAMEARDMEAAFRWAADVDAAALEPDDAVQFHRARLVSGQTLGRYEFALESLRVLEARFPDALRIDAQALLAAARTYEAVGLLDLATRDYLWFANVHPRAPECSEATLNAARLQARAGNVAVARRYFDWLIERGPASREAAIARLDLLELDGASASPESASGYRQLLTSATDASVLRSTCDRFVERFLGAGLPGELAGALMNLAEEPGGELGPIAARQCLAGAIGPVLALYALRADDVTVAAIALRASSLGVTIPAAQQPLATRSLERLGIGSPRSGLLESWIDEARALRRDEAWDRLRPHLEPILSRAGSTTSPELVEGRILLAETLWREDRADEALVQAKDARALASVPPMLRKAQVLLGDILFTRGERVAACAEYEGASLQFRTRWVDLQLERCQAPSAHSGGERVAS